MRIICTFLILAFFTSINYGQFCSGTTVLTDCEGEFDDGSGNSDYSDDSDCAWLIQVPMDSTITLFFNSFDTESCCDRVRVYNGANDNAPLFGEYVGSTIPSIIQSSTNEILIEFVTDGSVTADGWSVSYTCNNISFIDLGYAEPQFSPLLSVEGSILEYEFEIQNNGNLDSGPFEVGFYASEDSGISLSDSLLFSISIDSLSANSSISVNGMNDLRESISAGVYNGVGFIIDPSNEVEEIGEENNIYDSNFEVLYVPYCLELTSVIGCQGTISDGSGSNNVVRETECSWLLESENNETIFLDFLSVELSSSDLIRLYDGENQNAPLIHEFRGNDVFYPIVSSGNSIFIEFDVSFFGDEGWSADYSCIDTSISNLILETSSNAFSTGSVIDFDIDVRNNGNSLSPASKIYFFGSVDNTFNITQDFLIDSIEIGPIATLEQMQVSYTMNAKNKLPSGEYRPIAVIDAFDDIAELNEEDNHQIFFDEFYIPYCPDTTTVFGNCSGILSDGSGDSDFTEGTDCSWLITSGPGEYVSISPLNVDLGSSSNSLKIYDGENNFGQLIAEYNGFEGNTIPSNILSTGENMYIEFVTSEFSTFGSGWDFQYSCVENTQVNFDYYVNYINENNFNNNIEYNFVVRNFGNASTPETKVYLLLSTNQSISSSNIILDSITLPSLQPYEMFPVNMIVNPLMQDVLVPGGSYYAGFHIDPLDEVDELNENDNSFIDNGVFDVPYCSGTEILDDCMGEFSDGSSTSDYADYSNCSWLVEGPIGSNIRLEFNEFETESCCDFVRIYDGTSIDAPLLGNFSGSSLPPTIQTSQPNAYVVFDTDGSSTRSGWEIEYECIEFFGDLQYKNGSTQFQITNNILNFSTIIENDGALPTDVFEIGFILSEDEVPSLTDFLISTEVITSLEPGEEVVHESMIDFDGLSISSGQYFLIVKLDVGEIIEENDEIDNNFISTFPIDIITSTDDLNSEAGIIIFSSNQKLVIKNDFHHYLSRMKVLTARGEVVLDKEINNGNPEHRFDVIDFPTGIYFISLELDNQFVVQKIFIP